jgi:hypothetical protein
MDDSGNHGMRTRSARVVCCTLRKIPNVVSLTSRGKASTYFGVLDQLGSVTTVVVVCDEVVSTPSSSITGCDPFLLDQISYTSIGKPTHIQPSSLSTSDRRTTKLVIRAQNRSGLVVQRDDLGRTHLGSSDIDTLIGYKSAYVLNSLT